MSKQVINQRHIYKIHSSRFRVNNWDLKLDINEAKDNKELISLGDSEVLDMIQNINRIEITEEDIFNVKKQISKLKKSKKNNCEKLKELYAKLEAMIFIKDYITIVFDSSKDWVDVTSGKVKLKLNGNEYVRLLGTNGGVKCNTVIFCNKDIHKELDRRLNNGRDESKMYIPAKFESYKALSATCSTPVTQPKGVLVIEDGLVNFKDDVIQLTDNGNGDFEVNKVKDYPIERQFADGCGMIRKELSEQWCIDLGCYNTDENGNKIADYIPSGFNIRNSWTKGMVFTFDFEMFAREVAHNYIVKDVWGKDVDIRNVDIIITTNMLKLWNAYKSYEHYEKCCNENGFKYRVAKILPKELETTRNMNYQFLQSYELSDEDINKLISPTVDMIKGALGNDYAKMLLFLKGNKITENDFLYEELQYNKALMIDENMKNDPFIKQKVHRMIEKKINDAKKGVIQVEGNYSIVSGDLYALCQYMFGMNVTGLLKRNEFYSKTWTDKGVDEIVAFRAPMTNHNNIKKMKLKYDELVNKWFKYMSVVTILNAWDTTMDILNGCDFDGDAVISTNNPILLKNTRDLLPIICEQKANEKKKITEKLLIKANKNGFNNNVGGVTNRATSMFDILAKFEKGTEDYNIVNKRILCMQGYQQEIIDSVKGCVAKKVPKKWYDEKSIKDENDLKYIANKVPYFFIYNYKSVMNEYKKYIENSNQKCVRRFGETIYELYNKKNKTEEELKYIEYYEKYMPVSKSNSTMNRICWMLEEEFKDINLNIKDNSEFNIDILKNDTIYSSSLFKAIVDVYEDYKENVKSAVISSQDMKKDDKRKEREGLINDTIEKLYTVCSNEDKLCNILIDLCYKSNKSKQFVWDICGDVIVKRLLEKNNYKIHYPIEREDGDIIWYNTRYKMIEKEIKEEI